MNFAFIKKEEEGQTSHINLMVLLAMPTLMHGAFLSSHLQIKVVDKVETNISGLLDRDPTVEQEAILKRLQQMLKDEKEKTQAAPKVKKSAPAAGKKISIVGRKRVEAANQQPITNFSPMKMNAQDEEREESAP